MTHRLLVEVVSPLILGGADSNACDAPPSLRAPSVRGQLRFWTRALAGEETANDLWGDPTIGQRTRVLPPTTRRRSGWLQEPKPTPLDPPNGQITPMIPPGDQILLRFEIPEDSILEKVQAVAWTWLHLGAVGRRSRRGYGSLVWRHTLGDLLEDWPRYRPSLARHRERFERHLKAGLDRVQSIFGSPGTGARRDIPPDTLATRDQVFVSRSIEGKWAISEDPTTAKVEAALKGKNFNDSYCEQESSQLGSQSSPSPIRWRTYPTKPGELRTVAVWFPVGYQTGEEVVLDSLCDATDYLKDTLGLDRSLLGNSIHDGD